MTPKTEARRAVLANVLHKINVDLAVASAQLVEINRLETLYQEQRAFASKEGFMMQLVIERSKLMAAKLTLGKLAAEYLEEEAKNILE